MKIKIKKEFIFIAILLLILSSALLIKSRLFANANIPKNVSVSPEPISAQYTDVSLFLSEIKQTQVKATTDIITGLIVPHHLLAKDMIAGAYAYASKGKYQNIVVLSPDHFQAGKTEVSVSERNFSTVFGLVNTDKEIARKLKDLSFVSEADFFYREHGLQAQLPFIKYYFPEAKVTTITFKPTTSQDKLDKVIEVLKNNLPADSLIIESTDFSHYLSPEAAALKDEQTINAINNNGEVLSLNQPDNLDSTAALYVESKLQKDFFKTEPNILDHKNSQNYTSEKVASSTSYLTVSYSKKVISEVSNEANFIFVGDIMLSRYIGEMMASRQDYDFPFKLIAPDLAGADLIFGNLETPVSINGKSANHLYSFKSDPKTLTGLKNAGFTVVSVANNHAFDWGLEAFTDTLSNLKSANLSYTGGGNNFNEAHAGFYQEINGVKTTILAYTDLLPLSEAATESQAGFAYLDEAQMVKDIASAKAKSDLVIVTFHWGQEYQTTSNAHQQKIAALAVSAGADLIVGHHPHVSQEVSEINGVTVAYSLGNFVFDQNFSKETATALILKVNIKNKKIIKVEPQTIKFNSNFQASLK